MVDRADVLGVDIDRLTVDETVARCVQLIERGKPAFHTSVNAAKLIAAREDSRLRDIIARSAVVGADGQSIVWASRLLRDPLPERVPGIELMERLLAVAEDAGYGVFILGARQEVLDVAVDRLRGRHPRLRLVGSHHGHFLPSEDQEVSRFIKEAAPEILFVAMSSPLKEYWIDSQARQLGVPLAVGVGGSIDVVAGVTRRAPGWMQSAGLEWLYRFLQEPRRLGKRYAITNALFVWNVAKEIVALRSPRA